ncbi:peptide ABC transporter substrate-binding protein [Chloroflexi bacterium TSY]|nr:peptide ABC transporter substrate-binding protein [Chloroflexi bacterium TSY]
MHNKRFALFAILIVAAMVLAACPAPDPSSGAAEGGEAMMASGPVTLDFNLATEPPSLDPSLGTDTTSISLINEMFLGLTELDPDTQEALPELATSWEASEDGTVWTFNMRDDVVYGVQRTCDARTASDYSYVLYVIGGCEAANTAEEVTDELMAGVAVEALDDFTVQFTLNFGASYFGQIASMWVTRPMPQAAIEEHGDLWTEPENIVTNGPFIMTEWIHGDSLQMVRNPHWYGWEELSDVIGNVEVMNFVMIEEESTEFAMFENDELDFSDLPLEQMDRALAGEFGDQYISVPRNCTYYYGFITTKEAVSDVRVRKALSMAVDRQTLADDILKGGQIPANTFTNPLNFGSPAGDTDVAPWALSESQGGLGYAAAIETAGGLMEEAGYPGGEGLSLTIGHNTSESHAKIAQAIQAMWSEVFPGLEVNVENQEWGVYLDSLENDAPDEGKPDVFRLGWCQDYPHANNWIHEVFNPDAGANRIKIGADSPQVGDAVVEFTETTIAAQTASAEEQLELYKQAEQLFIDEIVGIIPIYYYTTVGVAKPWLTRPYSDDKYFYRWSIDAEAKAAAQ